MSIGLLSDEELLQKLHASHDGFCAEIRRYPLRGDSVERRIWVNGWMYVSSGYCLLEQVLKVLIHVHDRNFDWNVMKDSNKCGHSFKKIYCHLRDKTPQGVLKRLQYGYRAYRSLHKYVEYEELEGFLKAVDRDYETWRYSLIEKREGKDNIHPITSVEIISEIVRLILSAIKAKVVQDDGLYTVGDKLENVLSRLWHDVTWEGDWERKEWIKLTAGLFHREGKEDYVNGLIRPLQAAKRGEVGIFDRLGPLDRETEGFYANLWRAFRKKINDEICNGDRDLMQLLHLISFPQGVHWDSTSKIFKRAR